AGARWPVLPGSAGLRVALALASDVRSHVAGAAHHRGLSRFLDGSRTRTVTITKSDGTRVVHQRDRSAGGVWMLIIGVMFLLHQNGWLTLDQSWPLFIMAGGAAILLGRGSSRRIRREL